MIIAIRYIDKSQDKAITYLFNQGYARARIINHEAYTSRFHWIDGVYYVFELVLSREHEAIFYAWLKKNNINDHFRIWNLEKFIAGCLEEGNAVVEYEYNGN